MQQTFGAGEFQALVIATDGAVRVLDDGDPAIAIGQGDAGGFDIARSPIAGSTIEVTAAVTAAGAAAGAAPMTTLAMSSVMIEK